MSDENKKYTRGIYAIIDTLAQDIIGVLQDHRHPGVAVRTFRDIANLPNSAVRANPGDYHFVRLGWLDDELNLIPDRELIMTGQHLIELEKSS